MHHIDLQCGAPECVLLAELNTYSDPSRLPPRPLILAMVYYFKTLLCLMPTIQSTKRFLAHIVESHFMDSNIQRNPEFLQIQMQ